MRHQLSENVYWHWQNLTEDHGSKRSGLWYGRGWLNLWRWTLNLCWAFGKFSRSFHLGISKDTLDGEVGITICLPYLISLWFHFGGLRLRYDDWNDARRDISLRIFDGMIWLILWGNPDEFRHRAIVIHVIDLIFGKTNYRKFDMVESRIDIPMPEKSYPATVKMYTAEWRRSRWPFPERIRRADVTPDEPIPHPGKGTESYNLDDDALWSGIYVAETPAEAAVKVRESVMWCREHYPL